MTKESVLFLIQNSDRPLKRKEIASRLGCPERTVTALISELRKAGEPVLNELNGYFYSTDPKAISHTASIMEAQALDMLSTARSLRSAANSNGQLSLV